MTDQARTDRIIQRLYELAAISDDPDCITRVFGTPAFTASALLVETWMKAAGLETRIDNISNVRGVLKSSQPDAKTFVVASHIDTVVNAGKYDGPLGVLIAIEIADQLIGRRDLPFDLEIIAFSDEEGVRFHSTFLGSKVVAGTFETELLMLRDNNNISLTDCLRSIGCQASMLIEDQIPTYKWLGYFEVHIEQGPVLCAADLPVGVVIAIAGQKRAEITFTGFAGHAGTVPMNLRSDALCAAAEFVLNVEEFAKANVSDMVATIGKLQVAHAASNVIPGSVTCTLDLRSKNQTFLSEAYEHLRQQAAVICDRRSISFKWIHTQKTLPVTCDHNLTRMVADSIHEAGYQVVELTSGAGHDAVPISAVAPVAMLFVRCSQGISHNPLEHVDEKDIIAALKTSGIFINSLINAHK